MLTLTGLLAFGAGAPSFAMERQPLRAGVPWCSSLTVRWGSEISPATGEDPLPVTYESRSHAACATEGFAALQLVEAKGPVLPFHVDHRSVYFLSSRPRLVILQPGQKAYEMIAKYRCDLGDAVAVASLRLAMPGSDEVLRLPMGKRHEAAYCKGGAKDPGNRVGIGPIAMRLTLP